MQTKITKPEPVSHTMQHKSKAANQAPLSKILQAYKERSALGSTVQREAMEEEDELLQGKFETAQREALPEEDEEPLQQKTENKTGLPDDLKSGVEAMSGYSMDDVRVHYNSSKPAQLQALAYTQGTDIHVGPGQEKHLPHEAWHVVQQKQGRVKPTVQMQEVQVNDDEGLEKEADVIGNNLDSINIKNISLQKKKISNTTIQRVSITIKDQYNNYIGSSGNGFLSEYDNWPKVRDTFERNVLPKLINRRGNRPWWQCAEPAAFAEMLKNWRTNVFLAKKYTYKARSGKMHINGFALNEVEFPNKTEKRMNPCAVCRQWCYPENWKSNSKVKLKSWFKKEAER